jgi:ankyrin
MKTIGYKETPLYVAAEHGQIDAVRFLLGAKADVNAQVEYIGDFGPTPLCAALRIRNADLMTLLLESGADPSKGSPLADAVIENNESAVKLLIKYKAEVQYGGVWGITPLHLAVRYGYEDIARLLLESGANPNTRDEGDSFPNGPGPSENTPLDDAALGKNKKMATLLIKHGAKTNKVTQLELYKFLSESSDDAEPPAQSP